jgi:hypothetical protein
LNPRDTIEIAKTASPNSRKSIPNQSLLGSSKIPNNRIIGQIDHEIIANSKKRVDFVDGDAPCRTIRKNSAGYRPNSGWNPNRLKRPAVLKNTLPEGQQPRAGLKCDETKFLAAGETE